MAEKRDQQKSKKHRTERPQRPHARATAHRPAEHESRQTAETARRQRPQERV